MVTVAAWAVTTTDGRQVAGPFATEAEAAAALGPAYAATGLGCCDLAVVRVTTSQEADHDRG